jgi:transposase
MEAVRMLADTYDVVIGVDTHRDHHTLAAVRSFDGAVLGLVSVSTDRAGYDAALAFATRYAPDGQRAWALEGTGSWGAGLARTLAAHAEYVIEIDRPNKAVTRQHAKSDDLDAIRAARSALGRERHAAPRGGETHDALRALLSTREGAVIARTAAVNQLRALVATAPDTIRERLRGQTTATLLRRARSLRVSARASLDERSVIIALRLVARRVEELTRETTTLEREISTIVDKAAPQLLTEPGIGPISAAQILISWSHPGRIHSEAAFAQLAGAAPIPASSGQTTRTRLNRGGDRQLNRALHMILLSRLNHDARTVDYLARQTRNGKTRKDTVRCLKRYLARHLYRTLEHAPQPQPNPT